jgi:hypothetical protein
VASAGVLAGHWLGYMAALPDPRQRLRLLAATGHGYWVGAVRVVVVAVVIAAAAFVASRVRQERTGEGEEPSTLLVARRLAILQLLGFVAMEVAERLLAGAPLSSLWSHDVVVFGLGAQLVVAALLAMALVGLGRAAVAVVRTLAARRVAVTRPASARLPLRLARPRPRLLAGAFGLRGPPLLLR